MRKNLSYQQGQRLIRLWLGRLLAGLVASYAAALGIMAMFRHFGGDTLMIIGFLVVFALMPTIVLLAFSLPGRGSPPLQRRHPPGAAILAPAALLISLGGIA